MNKKKNKKLGWLFGLALLLLLLFSFIFVMYNTGFLNYITGTGSPSDSSDTTGSAGDSGTSDGSDDSQNDGATVQRTFTGGGVLDPDAPCTTYQVTETFDDPYLLFSYSADWGFCDCEQQVVIWRIYSDNVLIKTITQDAPGSGQTIIRNYNGGDIKVCLQQRCMYCDVAVSWTLNIFD